MHHPSARPCYSAQERRSPFTLPQTKFVPFKEENHKDTKLERIFLLFVSLWFFCLLAYSLLFKKTDVRPKQKDTDCIIAISSSKWQFTFQKMEKELQNER